MNNNNKKYWCFTCNSECTVNIIKEGDDEDYQCSKCKDTFIEEISSTEDNPQNFHTQQSSNYTIQRINNNNQNDINNLNININTINTINLNNLTNNTNDNTQSREQTEDEYGLDNTLLFLPSTVHYIRRNNRNNNISLNNIISQMMITRNNRVILSQNIIHNGSNPFIDFLSNHNNDNQFENYINIIMSFDAGHKGNPPASEKAINRLKKEEINKDNIKFFEQLTCNICLENFIENKISIKLDCGHYFHDNCIIKWLKMRNTCPVCRHELESNDPDYERRKHSHRTNLRNINNNYSNMNNDNDENMDEGSDD